MNMARPMHVNGIGNIELELNVVLNYLEAF
jgi:hypothetical protein